MAMAFGSVYTFGPTFRAEKSNTPRHAAEFWMIEPEIAFADLQDDMALAQDMIKYVLRYVLEQCPQEMKFFNDFYDKELISRLQNLIEADFGQITYTEAVKLLEQHKEEFEYPVYWGCDLQTEHERYLTEKIFQKPVFVGVTFGLFLCLKHLYPAGPPDLGIYVLVGCRLFPGNKSHSFPVSHPENP